MGISQVSELQEARALLDGAEKASNPRTKAKMLQDGVEILESYCEDNPNLEKREHDYILELRKAHTRSLLSQLLEMKNLDIHTWVNYFALLNFKLKNEMEFLVNADSELNRVYKEFIEIYQKDLLEALERVRQGKPPGI